MQHHIHGAYARARVEATAADAARRHVANDWESKGRRSVVVEWDKPATLRRLFDCISYTETYIQHPAVGEAG